MLFKQLLVHSDFHSIFFILQSSGPATLVTHILQNIFCVQHMKEINTGLGHHVSE